MHNYNAPDYTRQTENFAGETEYESFQGEDENPSGYETEYEDEWEGEQEGTFNETEQNELVNEMPSGESEAELDHFIQRLLHRAVGRRKLSSDADMARTLRRLLKGLTKKLFRTRKGGGHRFTHAVGEVNGSLQSEVFANENEFEARRKFVRMAGSAARRAFNMRRNQSAAHRARLALKGAAGQHLPALLRLRRYHRHSKNLAVRLGHLESSLLRLAEKISAVQPNDNAANSGGSPAAPENPAEGSDTEYEGLYNEDYGNREYEENEYEENEYEENEYEENEYENEYEENEYEENEYEENEYEDNEYEHEFEDQEYEAPRGGSGSCGCKSCSGNKSAQKEYEENEYEENEYEENEYEENEYEENEYEENENEYEYEENEFEENEFESEYGEREATFNESVQMELASELLNVQSEHELDQFLGKLIKKASRAVKKIAKVAIPGPLGSMLKKLAKKALPIAGGILGGTFAPGIGNMLGGKLGGAAANLFELELEGLSAEDREFEKAKAFVRFAGNAVKRSTMLKPTTPPARRAKVAFRHAARRYAPGLLRNRRRVINRRPVQRRKNTVNPHRRRQWRRPAYGQPQLPGQHYPAQGGALPADQPDNYPDHTTGDTGMLNSKMDALENVIRQLNERVASLAPNSGDSNSSSNAPAGNGSEGADNEYWN